MDRRRQSTETSSFGAGRRESHDASAFYERFPAPEISDAEDVPLPTDFLEPRCIAGDARHMDEVRDGSVALVVTSPPYFAGKEYEEELGEDGVPGSYLEYLAMLHAVFAECVRKLEPGGRIAVNVANLGRKPYRSLSADVIRILQDELHLLLRGEVFWQKAKGATNSVAFGSYKSAANPVLRDLTERVIIASKGRFDRARSPKQRETEGLPYESTTTADEFLEAVVDVWDIAPESARRVKHPAPFPVALPKRLINLYTYKNDLVLDPFLGSGTTLVAAVQEGRRGVGYDLDGDYVRAARQRVGRARAKASAPQQEVIALPPSSIARPPDPPPGNFQARAYEEGQAAKRWAQALLDEAGFDLMHKNYKPRGAGVQINFHLADRTGGEWFVDASGAFSVTRRGGLLRTDTVWKALGRALVLGKHFEHDVRLILLSSDLPRGEGERALRKAGPRAIWDVIQMGSPSGQARLVRYATGGCDRPVAGFWTDKEIAKEFS